jgi:hypothetical protein
LYEKFSLMQAMTSSSSIQATPNHGGDEDEDLCRLLTIYEDLVHDAFHDIDTGKEHEVIISLDSGPLCQSLLKIDEYLITTTSFPRAGSQAGEADMLGAQVTALFTIIEIIGAIAVMFPGVFVSVGVPATLAKSLTVLHQVQKVYPGVQLVLDRKNEIMILVGTMAAFAGGMQKNATRLLQQMETDESIQHITVVDETGKTIPVSELVQYALDLEANQISLQKDEDVKGQVPGNETQPDIFQKLTRLMDSITKPVGESIKNVDQVTHQGIQARMEDISRGKEFVLQVPLTLSDVGVRVGTDISVKIRELSERVNSITRKDETKDDESENG